MLIRVSRTGRVAVVTVDASKSVLLLDGKATGPTVDGAQEPTFSPDGKELWWKVEKLEGVGAR